jgi:hypothetical protein
MGASYSKYSTNYVRSNSYEQHKHNKLLINEIKINNVSEIYFHNPQEGQWFKTPTQVFEIINGKPMCIINSINNNTQTNKHKRKKILYSSTTTNNNPISTRIKL